MVMHIKIPRLSHRAVIPPFLPYNQGELQIPLLFPGEMKKIGKLKSYFLQLTLSVYWIQSRDNELFLTGVNAWPCRLEKVW
jgi:hypothetical protein